MTTDHESPDRDDRDLDDQVARRLRHAVTGMDLPTTTAAEAAAHGRRMQTRTRLGAGAGLVAVIAAAIVFAISIQPLGTTDIVDAPPSPTSSVSAVASDPTPGVCPSATQIQQSTDPPFPEARLDSAGIEGWALLFAGDPPWPTAGDQIKIVWRLEGTEAPEAAAISPSGHVIKPDDLTPHEGSNWDRPGDEWGTIWTLPQPGCWELRMTRDEGSASLHIQVEAAPACDHPHLQPPEDADPVFEVFLDEQVRAWAYFDSAIQGVATLRSEPPSTVGQHLEVLWHLEGSGEPGAVAIGPFGTEIEPDEMTLEGGANWNGLFAEGGPFWMEEWATAWTFDEPGCWELRMTRGEDTDDLVGEPDSVSLHVQVASPDVGTTGDMDEPTASPDPTPPDVNDAGFTPAELEARIEQARVDLAEVPQDNFVHEAMADGIVTDGELVTALENARLCAPAADIRAGDHIGDLRSTSASGGDTGADGPCIDEHYGPMIQAFGTLFEPTDRQRAEVPACPDGTTDCLDRAEEAVDRIMFSNLRLVHELGQAIGPEAPSGAGEGAAHRLHFAARDGSGGTLEPFAEFFLTDDVELWLGPSILGRTATQADLANPAGWVLPTDTYAAYTGPFSALESLARVEDIRVSAGPQPHCASLARPSPSGLEGLSRVAIEPADYESCLDWFVVNLWLDNDDRVHGIQLDLYEP